MFTRNAQQLGVGKLFWFRNSKTDLIEQTSSLNH